MMILLFILITFMIKSSFDNNKVFDQLSGNEGNIAIKDKDLIYLIDLQSFYIKILVNWIQLSSLLYVLPLTWPNYIFQFFDIFSFFTSISTKFMAFECIFNQDDYGEFKPYMKTFSVNIMPFILVLMTIIFWKIYQKIKKIPEIYDKIYASVIGIYIMMQQNIMNESLNALSCIQIEGKNYLENDPVYSCDTDLHFYLKSFFLWPVFVIWGFLLPIVILIYLFIYRKKLYEAKVFKRINFFYIGYREKYFYWDILILLRKSISIFLGLFTKNEMNSQLMILLMIMSLYLKYLTSFKPFLSENLNFLETLACSCALFGIFLTLLINLLTLYSDKIIFYVFVLISNVLFVVIWTVFFLFYLLQVYRKLIKKRYPILFQRFIQMVLKLKSYFPTNMMKNSNSSKKIISLDGYPNKIFHMFAPKQKKISNNSLVMVSLRSIK